MISANTLGFSKATASTGGLEVRRGPFAAVQGRVARHSARRSELVGRCLVVAMFVGILIGYGYVLHESDYQPPPSLSRVN